MHNHCVLLSYHSVKGIIPEAEKPTGQKEEKGGEKVISYIAYIVAQHL